MQNKIRLDKFLCDCIDMPRSEIKKKIIKGLVSVNKKIIKSPKTYVDIENDIVVFMEKQIKYEKYVYYILDKPKGYVSAREDNKYPCVTDLIERKKNDLSVAGRLDKDTTGLIIVTNDGEMIHKIISPKKNVDKLYLAGLEKDISNDDIDAFKNGITLSSGEVCLSAILCKAEHGNDIFENAGIHTEANFFAFITIHEGKYHQIKRMFKSCGNTVLSLRRLKIGRLSLKPDSKCNDITKISKKELEELLF